MALIIAKITLNCIVTIILTVLCYTISYVTGIAYYELIVNYFAPRHLGNASCDIFPASTGSHRISITPKDFCRKTV